MAQPQKKAVARKKPAAKKAATRKKAAPAVKKSTAKKAPRKGSAKKAAAKTRSISKKAVAKKTPVKKAAEKGKIAMNDTANDFKAQAGDAARSAADRGKNKASEAIGGIGGIIRDSAGNIDDSLGEQYGDYARSAADKVDEWSERIGKKDVDDIVDDAREFVREKPAIAIGAAAIVGFALVRLLRSGRNA